MDAEEMTSGDDDRTVDGMKSGLNWNNYCAGCVGVGNVISFYFIL